MESFRNLAEIFSKARPQTIPLRVPVKELVQETPKEVNQERSELKVYPRQHHPPINNLWGWLLYKHTHRKSNQWTQQKKRSFFQSIRIKNLTVTPKKEKLPKMIIEENIGYTRSATPCDTRGGKLYKVTSVLKETVHTRIMPVQASRESTMWQHSKLHPIC